MRKLKVLAAALGLATCLCAHAQSSVTLYGILDAGIAYIHNSGGQSSQWKMSTGNISENEWGLKGTEDLGGGITATFDVESGFNLATGEMNEGNRLFGRQAYRSQFTDIRHRHARSSVRRDDRRCSTDYR